MPNLTIKIPSELKRRMDAVETINWSAVARNAFAEELDLNKRARLLRKMAGRVRRVSPEEGKARSDRLGSLSFEDFLRELDLDR